MAKADREPIPLYRVWWAEAGEAEADGALYGALDIERAAKLYAEYKYRHRNWRENWPNTFRVRDPASGKIFEVEVALSMLPVFVPGKAKEIA